MDTTERRRLVYEILVEMQNIEQNTRNAEKELKRLNEAAGVLKKGLKSAFALFGIGFSLQAIGGAIEKFTQLDEQLDQVKDSFLDAFVRSSEFLNSLNEEGVGVEWLSFWEKMGERAGRFLDLMAQGARLMPGFASIMANLDQTRRDVADDPIALTIDIPQGAEKALQESMARVSEAVEKSSSDLKINPYPSARELLEGERRLAESLKRGEKALRDEQFRRDILDAREAAPRVDLDVQGFADQMDAAALAGVSLAQSTLEISERMPVLGDIALEVSEEMEQAASVLADSFVGIFTGATRNAREFFASLTQGMANVAAQAASNELFEMLLGALKPKKISSDLLADSFFAFLPHAKGGAFEHGQVLPFQHGGVVTGPTAFGLAGGRAGVMGEAGAEAIMPLKRGADGRLGVGATQPTVQVINNLGVPASARVKSSAERMEIILEAAQMGSAMAVHEVNRSMRTGYGATAQGMQRTYGLTRRG